MVRLDRPHPSQTCRPENCQVIYTFVMGGSAAGAVQTKIYLLSLPEGEHLREVGSGCKHNQQHKQCSQIAGKKMFRCPSSHPPAGVRWGASSQPPPLCGPAAAQQQAGSPQTLSTSKQDYCQQFPISRAYLQLQMQENSCRFYKRPFPPQAWSVNPHPSSQEEHQGKNNQAQKPIFP